MGWNRCFSNKKGSITLLAGYIRKWLYIYLEKSFFPSDRVWLNMTLGIWNCFWSHKNYFWRREDAYDIDYTNIHSRAHSSLNWEMLFSINISLFAYAHFTWHSNTPLLTSSKLDLETACYCWVRTFSTTILRFTGYGYFQFVHINFLMNKETINQLGKAKHKSFVKCFTNYIT